MLSYTVSSFVDPRVANTVPRPSVSLPFGPYRIFACQESIALGECGARGRASWDLPATLQIHRPIYTDP